MARKPRHRTGLLITEAKRQKTLTWPALVAGSGTGADHDELTLAVSTAAIFDLSGQDLQIDSAAQNGDLITISGGSYAYLNRGTDDQILRMSGTALNWENPFDATAPADVTLSSGAGSAATFSHRDHAHALDQSIAPTLTGIWTHAESVVLDDGAGDSPLLRFRGVSDDPIDIYLIDQGAGASDLTIDLADAAGASTFRIRDNANVNQFKVYSDADVSILFGGALRLYSDGESTVQASVDGSTGDVAINGDLQLTGGGTISSTVGDITLNAADDILLDPTGNVIQFENWASGKFLKSDDYVSQNQGWAISYGNEGGDADFRYIFANEMHVRSFVAEIYSALAGALIITKSRSRLSRDFTIPDTSSSNTLYVEDLEGWPDTAVFTANDYVLLHVVDLSGGGLVVTDVFGQVTGYSDLSGGEQSWTFTTTTTGYYSGQKVYRGAVALDYGQTGSGSRGVWSATVLDTYSPYSQVQTWDTISGGEPSNFTTHVRTGHLQGITSNAEFGVYAGKQITDKQYVVFSDSNVEMHGVETSWYDGSGNLRVFIDPTATGSSDLLAAGPDVSTDKRFTISGAGNVWLSALAVSDFGSLIFQPDDLLLLDFQEVKTDGTDWFLVGSRGELATVSGPIHQLPGRWRGHRAVQVEETSRNYILNPLLHDGNSDNTADLWTIGYSTASAPTPTIKTFGTNPGWWQRIQYTADPTDSGDYMNFYIDTDAGSFSYLDAATFSVDLREIDLTGCTLWLRIRPLDNVGSPTGSDQDLQITTANKTQQRFEVTYSSLPASTDHLRCLVLVQAIGSGDSLNIWIGRPQVEKLAYSTSFVHGNAGRGYTWNTGSEHNGQSLRAETEVNLDSYNYLFDQFDPISIAVWLQSFYAYDGGPSSNWNVFHAANDAGTQEIQFFYNPGSAVWTLQLNDGTDSLSKNSSAQTFDAGDRFLFVFTLDFNGSGAGSYKLYINGVEEWSDTTSNIGAPNINQVNIGSTYTDANFGGFIFDRFAVFNRVLSAEEVATMHALKRPVVDAYGSEGPGIFIIDGKFRVSSSIANSRVELLPQGMGVYGNDGETGIARLLGGFVNTTSKVLDPEGDSLGWFGYDASDNLQVAWHASGTNAGAIVGGSEKFKLNDSGLTIVDGTGTQNNIQWQAGSLTGATLGELYCDWGNGAGGSGNYVVMWIRAFEQAGSNDSLVALVPYAQSGNHPRFTISSAQYVETLYTTDLRMYNDNQTTLIFEISDGEMLLDQSANDGAIIKMLSSDVSHGFGTGVVGSADTFGEIIKQSATDGGLMITGAKDTGTAHALVLRGGLDGTATTAKSTSAGGVVTIVGAQQSSGALADLTSDGNIMVIRNNATTSFIFDAEGQGHSRVAWTTFDEHDDVALLGTLEKTVVAREFGDWAEGNKALLESLGIAHFDDVPGRAMVNWTRLTMLLTGAIRQLGGRLERLERIALEGETRLGELGDPGGA